MRVIAKITINNTAPGGVVDLDAAAAEDFIARGFAEPLAADSAPADESETAEPVAGTAETAEPVARGKRR